jgi:hypothetical protein
MSQEPNKKRIVAYTIIFVLIAFAIVFFTRKNAPSNNEASVMRDTLLPFESENIRSFEDHIDPETVSSAPIEQPSITVKNTDAGLSTTITKEDAIAHEVDKRVIKTGEMNMRVNSIEIAIDQIKNIARTHGGDEVSSDFSKSTGRKQGYIIVKIPVEKYTETFEAIKDIAPLVTHESSRAQDVTAQFIDLESRIKNKKEHESRLRTFFDRAEDVDELIQIERELARVRTEIEQMEGQLNYLKDQTQFSTIHITLLEDENIVISEEWRPLQVVKDSFNTLIRKSTNLLNSVIRFTITSLPFIIIFAIGAWFLYFTAKHIFKK